VRFQRCVTTAREFRGKYLATAITDKTLSSGKISHCGVQHKKVCGALVTLENVLMSAGKIGRSFRKDFSA